MRNLLPLLVFCSLLSLGSFTLLGAKKCTFGPSFWCESIPNAKQCNAVKHCIQTTWETQILPEDNDEICNMCKKMVAEARDQLESNETQEEIKQVFEGSCKLIPLEIVRHECIKLADEFVPELIETLSSQMNPQVVCATAGLCNSARIDRLLEKYAQNEIATETHLTDECNDCTSFVQDVITDIKNHPTDYLFNHLIAICGRLSSLSDGCRALVEVNFKEIYKFFTQELRAKDVCDLFGMCPRMYGGQTVSFKRGKDDTCQFCEAVIRSWRNSLTSNTTKSEFKMILDGICHQTGQFEKECLSLVDQYFEIIYDVILSQIQPEQICESVGLCGEHSIFKTETPFWPLFEMKPENHLALEGDLRKPSNKPQGFAGNDEFNSYKRPYILPRAPLSKAVVDAQSLGESGILDHKPLSSKVQKFNMCIMCEFVLHFLQNVLNEKMTREEVRHELDKVCTYFPKSIVEECQDYVDAYSNDLIQYIVLYIDPSSICPAIHMCPSHLNIEEKPTCVLCEFVMTQLDEMLKDKNTEEEIKTALDQVCTLLPKSIKSECKTFIDVYIDQLVDLLVNDYTPREICGEIGLCSRKHRDVLPALPEASDAQLPVSRLFVPVVTQRDEVENPFFELEQTSQCVLCEFIMSKIDSFILRNSTEQTIKLYLEKTCHILPSSLMSDCVAFLDEYCDSLIQILVSDLSPEITCSQLGICKRISLAGLPKAVVQMPVDKCDVCRHVMNYVVSNERRFKVDKIDVASDVAKNVCQTMLSPQERKMCEKITDTQGMYLLRLFDVLNDGDIVCQSIRQCPLEHDYLP